MLRSSLILGLYFLLVKMSSLLLMALRLAPALIVLQGAGRCQP